MFDWVTLIILIGCTLVCLVPTAIAFWLIPYLKEQVSFEASAEINILQIPALSRL